ncbi:hypothetical protein HDU80_011672 [Chytriomyces hyalinus]|nr:hypothetical protein HDU80_011672 [Chytriomyces hyalinus]
MRSALAAYSTAPNATSPADTSTRTAPTYLAPGSFMFTAELGNLTMVVPWLMADQVQLLAALVYQALRKWKVTLGGAQ